jgi:hypothetical protein
MSCFDPQTISYKAERIVGSGSFGIVFQVIELLNIHCRFPIVLATTWPDVKRNGCKCRLNAWKLESLWPLRR